MKQSIDNLHSSLNDINILLDLSSSISSTDKRTVVFRSAVVLLIASWEQYIEQLADSSIILLTNRLRDSSTLPEKVKQSISKFSIPEKCDSHKYSDSVWSFADKGWKTNFKIYCQNQTSRLNTASSKNLIELYENLLGIENIAMEWGFQTLTPDQCVKNLDDVVDLRHDIAHGANKRINELTEELIREQIEFLLSLSNQTYQTVFNRTAELSQSQAIKYSIAQSGLLKIISYASHKGSRILTLKDIKSLGSSAQGNHNKLCYEPWSLLEKIDYSSRHITDKLLHFYNDDTSLPLEILVFDNDESIAKPGTRSVKFSEL